MLRYRYTAIVWTVNDSTYDFFATTEPRESSGVTKALHSMRMENTTGNIEARAAIRYSDDGITWDAPANVGSDTRSTAGDTTGTTWIDLSTIAGVTRRRYFQLGFNVKRLNSATYTVMCRMLQAWEFER